MAVFTPGDAFSYAKTMVKSMRLDDVKLRILFDALSLIWHAAPWEWTIGEIAESPITVTTNTSEYTITVPSDFSRLEMAILTDDANIFKPLAIRSYVPSNSVKTGETMEIAKVPGQTKVRVYPKSPASLPSTAQKIILLYKKTTPNLTASDYASTTILALPDDWFHVYCLAVLYFAYLYADDDRAGGAVVEPTRQGANIRYTGIRGQLEAEIEAMRMKLPLLRVMDVRADMVNSKG